LPDESRLGQISLLVSDLHRAAVYYTGVLGLRVIEQSRDRVALGAAGSIDTLVELHHGPGARPVPRSGLLGLYHFAIVLPARADLGRFVSHLARKRVPFASADHLVSEAIYLWDPDGLGIEVYADRPRDQWQTRGQELLMATDPLNLDNLVAAAGNEPWTAMPTGTVIGHLHLSVSDLGTARRFYHAALGFDVTVWSYPGALFLSAGAYHHHLGANTWAASAPAATETDARLLEWALVLPEQRDVHRAALRLRNSGYDDLETERGDRLIVDPWGTVVRLTRTAAGAVQRGETTPES
jgi:catechol 2,3-dioxygenase